MILGLAENILEESFIYGIMAMGVYITYRILDFPDLSVDGTFPLGACVAAALITAGADPWLACAVAFGAGAGAGCVTGLLHVRLGVTDLLSGIIVMTGLWTVNLLILKQSSLLAFYNKPTIFNSGPASLLPDAVYPYRVVLMVFVAAALVKVALDWFLRTKLGLLLRATGDNGQFVTALARDPGKMKILGLAVGNGCTAVAGCVLAQQAESANINLGVGMVVQALAAVIIGTSVFHRLPRLAPTTMVLLGTVLYKACLTVAMLAIPSTYLKLLMAVLLTGALLSQRMGKKGGLHHVV